MKAYLTPRLKRRPRLLPAEVELERLLELPGEIEGLQAMLWARLTIRSATGPTAPDRTEDRLLVAGEAAAKLGVPNGATATRLPSGYRWASRGATWYLVSQWDSTTGVVPVVIADAPTARRWGL